MGDLIPGAAIRSERDLLVSILSYVAAGTGGERYVESSAALAAFSARFRGTTTLGGTNVRAGLVMAALEVPSTLYLFGIDDEFRRLLPASISYTSSGEGGRMFPHLIVQLYRGDKIRCRDATLTVRRSDRLIYVHDPANSSMLLDDSLRTLLTNARTLLISGFNAVRDEALLRERLETLRRYAAVRPFDAVTVTSAPSSSPTAPPSEGIFCVPFGNHPAPTSRLVYSINSARLNESEELASQTRRRQSSRTARRRRIGSMPPSNWSGPTMTRKYRANSEKEGFVWRGPRQRSVRIDRGNPDSPYPSQQVDHVVINDEESIVGRDGKTLTPGTRIEDVPDQAHIPLSEWVNWGSWNAP